MKIRTTPVYLKVATYLIILGGAIVFLLPLYWVIIWSSWDTSNIFTFPPRMIPGPNFVKNFLKLQEKIIIARLAFNSMFIALSHMVGALFFCSLAGFAFAKYKFRGSRVLFYFVLGTMAIPFQVVVVPLFVVMQRLNLINSYASVIVPGLAPAFGIFLMRQSVEEALPDELLDAARIDGATEFGIYSKIALPIMKPNLAALAIFFFMGSWNDFFCPLVVLRTQDMFTLPVALSAIIGVYERPYGPVMVGSFISIVPPLVIFLALQKYFMRGLVAGAFK